MIWRAGSSSSKILLAFSVGTRPCFPDTRMGSPSIFLSCFRTWLMPGWERPAVLAALEMCRSVIRILK